MHKGYDMTNKERVPLIINWLGYEVIHFMQTLTDEEQERCKSSAGFYTIQNSKFKSQKKETILLLQSCKLRDTKIKVMRNGCPI